MSKMQKIIDLLSQGLSVKEICKKARVKPGYVYTVRSQQKKSSKKKSVELPTDDVMDADIEDDSDMVNSPFHYTAGGIETIDFIEAKKLGYNLGNAVKYISRCSYKHMDLYYEIRDLEKAVWYINREIDNLRKMNG